MYLNDADYASDEFLNEVSSPSYHVTKTHSDVFHYKILTSLRSALELTNNCFQMPLARRSSYDGKHPYTAQVCTFIITTVNYFLNDDLFKDKHMSD